MEQLRELAPHSRWLQDLYDEYLKQTRTQLDELLKAVNAKETQKCLFLLHSMKSSSGQIGGIYFADQIKEWELLLSEDANQTQVSYYQDVERAFVLLQSEIRKVLDINKGQS